jgi:hypothetical protein
MSKRRFSMETLEDRTVPAQATVTGTLPDPLVPRTSHDHAHHVGVNIPDVGPNPGLGIGESDDAETLYVQKLYFDLLGRNIDAGGMVYADALNAGDVSRRDVAESILGSDEYAARQIDGMFQAFLGRNADPPSLDGYVKEVGDGKTLEDVAVDLLSSDEYRALHAGDAPFITALYHDVLGRTPDTNSAVQYVERLADADGVRSVVEEIVTSSESRRMAGETAVLLMLNQPATATVGAKWVADATNGALIDDVLADLANSNEYFVLADVE